MPSATTTPPTQSRLAERGGLIGQLAAAAKTDRAFPKDGDPTDVRKRLNLQGADPDMHEALDDAELDWKSY